MKQFLLYFLLLTGLAAKAQQPKAEKIEALYIAYMTRELKLTAEDAQKFWPLHAQYDNEIRELRKKNPDMNELDREQDVLNIKKKYQERFTKILGAERNNEFRKKLTERLKKMRQQNQNNPKQKQE